MYVNIVKTIEFTTILNVLVTLRGFFTYIYTMKYILTILMFSVLTFNYSQEIEKAITKKSNTIIVDTDMLGHLIKVIKDKKGNRVYIEHTIGNKSRFVVYKNNKAIRHGEFTTELAKN